MQAACFGIRPNGASERSERASEVEALAVDSGDPVRVRRERVARWTRLANRAGYVLLGLAVGLFFVALATGFNGAMATLVLVSLIAACALLAPSIVLGYAVKAAEREDRERGL
jgi:hypothetical protein